MNGHLPPSLREVSFRRRRVAWWPAVLVTCLAAMLAAGGCSGCNGDEEHDKTRNGSSGKTDQTKTPKPPEKKYEFGALAIQPDHYFYSDQAVKPGHWSVATRRLKANLAPLVGEMEVSATDRGGDPIEVRGTPFRIRCTRPINVAKGQTRFPAATLFVPPRSDPLAMDPYDQQYDEFGRPINPFAQPEDQQGFNRRVPISNKLYGRSGGLEFEEPGRVRAMRNHEYFFVVLSPERTTYGWIEKLHTVREPADTSYGEPWYQYYQVRQPAIAADRPVLVPAHPLAWTSIAAVLVDDFDPHLLTADQQTAMLDWLHWGGRLILSGPKSIDRLRTSFLDPYLPATEKEATTLSKPSGLETWWQKTIEITDGEGTRVSTRPFESWLSQRRAWPAVVFQPAPPWQAVPNTGGLFIRRPVGRGSIVVSTFRLSEQDLDWPRFDKLFSQVLLARREYRSPLTDGRNRTPLDSNRVTAVRYFTRDSVGDPAPRPELADEPALELKTWRQDPGWEDETRAESQPSVPGHSAAGWDDESGASQAARQTLRKAAGIEVPDAGFVIGVLAVYLVVLVPLNWLVFRVLGRIELAWVAAPVISLAFAGLVVHLAQLDIGFVRSNTQLEVIELQGGYPRAHVTRYTALYSSLSTEYEMHFDDSSAVSLPFPTGVTLLRDQSRSTVSLHRADDVTLAGFAVSSNSTGFLHSEQMADLGGAIRLERSSTGGLKIVNESNLRLEGAILLRGGPTIHSHREVPRSSFTKAPDVVWLGQINPGQHVRATWQQQVGLAYARQKWETSPFTAVHPDPDADALNLEPLLRRACDPQELQPGWTRLVAYTTDETGGVRIEPAASQTRHAAVVIVHWKDEG